MDKIEITLDEYRALVRRSAMFDYLHALLNHGRFVSDVADIGIDVIYEVEQPPKEPPQEEQEDDEEW